MKHSRRRGAIQHEEPAVDFGTTGEAQRARLSHMFEPQKIATTQEKMELKAYRVGVGHTVRRMDDVHPLDTLRRMGSLTDRQLDAAWHLVKIYLIGYPERTITPSYGHVRGGDSGPEADAAKTGARHGYDKMMKLIKPEYRHVLQRMVRRESPGVTGGMQLLRLGLEQLADILKLPREVFRNGEGWRDE